MDFSVKLEGLDRLAGRSKLVSKIAREELKKALLASGLMVEKSARESISAGGKTGRTYRRGNVTHQASAPGEAPASDTGRLVNSTNVRLADSDTTVEIAAGGEAVKYARMLEFGTANMEARPFLFPALEKNKARITKRMEAALDRTIARAARQGVGSLKE